MTSSEDRIHLSGTNCSSCGNQFTLFNMPLPNYTLQAGDTLFVSQYSAGSRGGLQIQLSGTNAFLLGNDSDGDNLLDDTVQNQWHHRTFAIPSSDVGKSLVGGGLTVNSRTPAGPWNMYFRDIVIVQADGAVVPLYNSGTSLGLTASPTSGVTGVSGVTEVGAPLVSQAEDIHYFVDDHLGTTQAELTSGGWPVWQGQFTPFGAELPDGATTMHYKFTGKERDTESGLDFFGARYYGSAMGRWLSPDWAAKPEAVPYSSLGDPQSLNLYNYVGNNPLSKADADGHDATKCHHCAAAHNPGTPGGREFVEGVVGLAAVALAAPEIGGAAVAAIEGESLIAVGKVAIATLATTGTAVNATTQIVGAATNTDTKDAREHVTAVTNPIAATVAVATGSAHRGAQAADVATAANGAVSLATKGKLANPADTAGSIGGAIDTVKSVASSGFTYVKNFLNPSPPPPPPAPRPPQ